MELKSFNNAIVGDRLLLTNANGKTSTFVIQSIDIVYKDYNKYKCIRYNNADLLYVPEHWRASCISIGDATVQLVRKASNHEVTDFASIQSGDAIYIVTKSGIAKAYVESIETKPDKVVITTEQHQQIPLAKYNLSKRYTKRLSTSIEHAKMLYAFLYK